jgi:hypothetical protein
MSGLAGSNRSPEGRSVTSATFRHAGGDSDGERPGLQTLSDRLGLLVLVLPDGHLPSRRWRPVLWGVYVQPKRVAIPVRSLMLWPARKAGHRVAAGARDRSRALQDARGLSGMSPG